MEVLESDIRVQATIKTRFTSSTSTFDDLTEIMLFAKYFGRSINSDFNSSVLFIRLYSIYEPNGIISANPLQTYPCDCTMPNA